MSEGLVEYNSDWIDESFRCFSFSVRQRGGVAFLLNALVSLPDEDNAFSWCTCS